MYRALYRKWRPMTFDDVVSQPHITTTLKRQISEGKTAHAYLFTGSRGTGKTTCARIFAKAVNCRNPHDGRPCLECDICKAADNGTLNDIIEIDAASNTGVDDIRELRESTVYTPELARYKVYIIDEVHMLSNQAWGALLKIMEEPPEHVKFILATTEIHKVPLTIISRCQRFDFRRILPEDIKARLLYIAEQEKISLDDEAATAIARISDGAMRDALSILDQCMAVSDNITVSIVSEVSGTADRYALYEILDGIAEGQSASVLSDIDKLYAASKDMSRLCDELIFQLRNVMLLETSPDNEKLLGCLPDELKKLQEIAGKLTLDKTLALLDILQTTGDSMSTASSKRTALEMAVIRMCGVASKREPGVSDSAVSELNKRISALEDEIEELKRTGVRTSSASRPERPAPKPASMPQNPEPEPEPVQEPILFPQWDEVLERLTEVNPGCAGALSESRGIIYGNRLMIEVQSEFFLSLFKKPENAKSLRDVVKEITGKSYAIGARCIKKDTAATPGEDKVAELMEKARREDIPFDID
ncbi:MAG: DNA polymerase III subunit gamma/tau [Oscillospiraceae bacterium]|nr:DNA polymerase III subunit gamma/tau [Oscillospiraceae bacterium]